MEADQLSRRRGKRKPLADCTNTIPKSSQSSSSTSIIQPTNPSVSSALKRLLNDTNTKPQAKSGFKTGSTNDYRKRVVAAANPSSAAPLPLASTPSRPLYSSFDSGTVSCEVFEPCSVYRRRQTSDERKSKGKAMAEPMSCPLAAKISNSGAKMNEEGNISLSKSCKVPHKKQRKLMSEQDVSKHDLRQDFIEQQRAYFAEIDAFELPEEEVTTVDELE